MMKRREADFWTHINNKMALLWDAQRHEDKYSTGIPDISYGRKGVNGWIELKACTKWPNGEIPYYTAAQALWLTSRGRYGGRCFLLVKVNHKNGYTILMFTHTSAMALLENANEHIMRERAIMVNENSFDVAEFTRVITDVQ